MKKTRVGFMCERWDLSRGLSADWPRLINKSKDYMIVQGPKRKTALSSSPPPTGNARELLAGHNCWQLGLELDA
jgi:hypothetical protein